MYRFYLEREEKPLAHSVQRRSVVSLKLLQKNGRWGVRAQEGDQEEGYYHRPGR